jgi:hypothetical protein
VILNLTFLSFLVALRRPTLSQDGHNRVLRALHHRDHHFKHFIRPKLLTLYSFGPELSEAVLSLQEINEKSEYYRQTVGVYFMLDDVLIIFCLQGWLQRSSTKRS